MKHESFSCPPRGLSLGTAGNLLDLSLWHAAQAKDNGFWDLYECVCHQACASSVWPSCLRRAGVQRDARMYLRA